MAQQVAEPRTYGGWRRRRGIGLFGLGMSGTLVLLGTVVVVMVATAVSPRLLLVVGPPALIGGAISLLRIGGTSVAQFVVVRLRWRYAVTRGWTKYRAGVVAGHQRAWQLPGVLAPTTLLDAEDGYGGRYGLVWDRRSGLMTPTLRVVSRGIHLANRDEADTWVANWGAWLASLGHMPMVRWVSVTVETSPDPGSTLAGAVNAWIDPDAPAPARNIINQLVAATPGASAHVDTRVSITFDPGASTAAPKGLTEAVVEIGRSLQGLEVALGSCGVTVLGRASAPEIAGMVRTAVDPHSRGEVKRILATHDAAEAARLLNWDTAGQRWAVEYPDRYLHDGGYSIAWVWDEAPMSNVPSDVLARLVAPAAYCKRVTLQYQPFSATEATRALEAEVNAGVFRRQYRQKTGRDETARDAYDEARARQAASEEAMGAGVDLLTVYVTATVTDADQLAQAAADTEAAADASRLRLRRIWGSQSPAFAATLPCGICPTELMRRWPH